MSIYAVVSIFTSIWRIMKTPITFFVKGALPLYLIIEWQKFIIRMISKLIEFLAAAISEAWKWLEGAYKNIKSTIDTVIGYF